MKTMKLEIVTPHGLVYDADVAQVTLPGKEGEFGVLPEHASLVSLLETGVITVQSMDGSVITIQTSAETEFYRMGHDGTLEEITFDDLTVGNRIAAEGAWDGDVFNASKIVAMPDMTQRARIQPIRARIQPGRFGAAQRP